MRTPRKCARLALPHDGAPIEQWQACARAAIEKVDRLIGADRKRVTQLRTLRKELSGKNKVLGHYKQRLRQMETELKTFGESAALRVLRSVTSLFRWIRYPHAAQR